MVTRESLRAATVVAFALACAAPAFAVPVAEYHERLDRAIAEVDSMYPDEDEGKPGAGPEALERARALLPDRETVELGDVSVDVDNGWLTERIDEYKAAADDAGRDETLERIATRLYAQDVAIMELDEAPEHASADERAKLQEILARPEFQPPKKNWFADEVREIRDKILEYLQKILEWLFGGSRGQTASTGMRVVILALGAVALILLVRAIAIAVARRGIGGKREKGSKKKKTRTILGEEVDESTTSDDIAAAGRSLAAAGDYRGAIRKLFVALIYRLDERGLVRLRAEATNREYLALVRGLATLHPVMASMTDVFERVWYGDEPAGRGEYEAFESMYTRAAEIAAAAAVAQTA